MTCTKTCTIRLFDNIDKYWFQLHVVRYIRAMRLKTEYILLWTVRTKIFSILSSFESWNAHRHDFNYRYMIQLGDLCVRNACESSWAFMNQILRPFRLRINCTVMNFAESWQESFGVEPTISRPMQHNTIQHRKDHSRFSNLNSRHLNTSLSNMWCSSSGYTEFKSLWY
jgi:hypothetical protein